MEEQGEKADCLLAVILHDAKNSEDYDLPRYYLEALKIHQHLKSASPTYIEIFNQLAAHKTSMRENGSDQKLREAHDREGFPATLQRLWLTAIYLRPILRTDNLANKLLREAMPYLTGHVQFAPSNVPNTPELPSRELGK